MKSVDSGPLNGLLVIDFSTLLPGPLAAQILAQAGARVIKIEKPEVGDEMRSYEPRWGSISANFAMLNAGKESVSIDLKSADALELLRPLLSDADILLEQFRPGVMARLGLDYETVKRINPRLIYCSISGFGQTGSKSQVAGHDLNYIADTGLLDLSMGPPEARVLPPALVADIAAGAFPAVMNILLALQQRNATGTGCRLDIAMTDALFAFQYWNIGRMQATGESTISGAELVTGGSPRYNLYNTRVFIYSNAVRQPVVQTVKKNENLKPEIKTSFEWGLDMKFFDNRLGFDFTYYNTKTKNQAMLVDASAPWTQQWVNAA